MQGTCKAMLWTVVDSLNPSCVERANVLRSVSTTTRSMRTPGLEKCTASTINVSMPLRSILTEVSTVSLLEKPHPQRHESSMRHTHLFTESTTTLVETGELVLSMCTLGPLRRSTYSP
jgi:hypothetical protein